MRQIFLDTETTGLSPAMGHRVIEIAAVEMVNRRLTQRHFHVYLNPQREIDPGAQEVHGITLEFLQDKPLFAQVAQELLSFVRDAELIIHNAPFDIGFLNAELANFSGMVPVKIEQTCAKVLDTLQMAKEMRPGQRNNLDALCKHFGVDNTKRTLHGALLDAELLAEVYLAMTRGQESLMMNLMQNETTTEQNQVAKTVINTKIMQANAQELATHTEYLQSLKLSPDHHW